MTFLEVAGVVALAIAGTDIALRLMFKREQRIPVSVAEAQVELAVRDAFQAGMMCAADIVTHSGHEQLAGDLRKTVEYVRVARADNDN